jgi:hypothetical protein
MCNHKEEIKETYKIGFTWLFPFPNLKKVSIWFFSTIGSGLMVLLLTVYSEKLKRIFEV